MDVVKAIGKVERNPQDRPLKDVVMESVTIEKR
ncbi:MAG: peptidylprolyl isomerase, partial [Ignavibacterium sp.]